MDPIIMGQINIMGPTIRNPALSKVKAVHAGCGNIFFKWLQLIGLLIRLYTSLESS